MKNVHTGIPRPSFGKPTLVEMLPLLLFLLPFPAPLAAIDYIHDSVQYQAIATDTGAYHFGYNTGVLGAHSFHEEWRDENGEVHGRYGLTDPNGNLRVVTYTAGRDGYQAVETVRPGNPVKPRPRPTPGSGHTIVTPGSGMGTVYPDRYIPTTASPPTTTPSDDDEDINNYRNALAFHGGPVLRPGGVVGPPVVASRTPSTPRPPTTSRRPGPPVFPFIPPGRPHPTPIGFDGVGRPLPPVLYHNGIPYRPTIYRNGVPYTGPTAGPFILGNFPPELHFRDTSGSQCPPWGCFPEPIGLRLSRSTAAASTEGSSKENKEVKEEKSE